MDSYRYPKWKGIKYLTETEKEAIHFAIDRRMKELEDTGLTRGEILNIKEANASLPLVEDPYFQLIKKDRVVREMLIDADEAFTVEKAIH